MAVSMRSFTFDAIGIIREIITPISVSDPQYGELPEGDSRFLKINALWDTGATNCVITPSCAKRLGLKPFTLVKSRHAGGESICNVYLVNIMLPNHSGLSGVRVTECADQGGLFDAIIGMDVITRGDFAITNVNGKTTVSFQLPTSERIDFVEKARLNDERQKRNIMYKQAVPSQAKRANLRKKRKR